MKELNKYDWFKLVDMILKATPELITAFVGYKTYLILKEEKERPSENPDKENE